MKKCSVIKLVLCAFVLSVCLASVSSFAAEKVITLRFGHYMPPVAWQVKLVQDWGKEVEQKTNGRVKVTVYPGQTLVSAGDTYDGVVKGVADIGWSNFSYSKGRFPLLELVDFPMGIESAETSIGMVNAFVEHFKPKETSDVKILWLETHNPAMMHTRKAVRNLEDFKGLKIRSNALSAAIVTFLGGAPVGMPIPEAYEALSRGVVDGIATDIEAIPIFGLSNVVKFHTIAKSSAYLSAFFTVMNKQKWDSLPPDVQKIIDQINKETIPKIAKGWVYRYTADQEKLGKEGHTFIRLTKEEDARWAERIKPLFTDYLKMTKEKGLPGEEALKWCQDYIKTHQK
jgi:TRAP-type transport system periplasmic protein